MPLSIANFSASILPRDFYDRPTTLVARELLGKLLIRQYRRNLTVGRIVETEAYLPQGDSACHAAKGRNRKNGSMFGQPGTAYVYVIHARFCFNVVTEAVDIPAAALVRAVEPVIGIPQMQSRRQRDVLTELARGPAMLCEALQIDRSLDGWDLTQGKGLWLAESETQIEPEDIQVTPRIGVTSAAELPLRFYLGGSPYVSKVSQREIQAFRANPSTDSTR